MSFFRNLFGGKKKNQQDDQQKIQLKQQTGFADNKGLEKFFLKSSVASESSERILVEDLKQIRFCLEGDNYEQAITLFFHIIERNQFNLNSRLKILTAIHKFIIELGENFAFEFLQYKFLYLNAPPVALDKKIKNFKMLSDQETFLYENIHSQYFNYLLRMSNNYQIYKICVQEGKLPQTDDSKLDCKLKFMWLFKLSNLFSYVLQIHKSLAKVFREMPSLEFVRDIGLLLLHDCVSYYNVLSKEMNEFMECYHLLTTLDSLQFYQVYCELIQLTNEMRSFYLQKQIFDEHDFILEPSWFVVSPQTHKDIEVYSKKMDLLNSSATAMRRTLKSGHDVRQSQIHFTEMGSQQPVDKARTKSAAVNGQKMKYEGRVRTESAINEFGKKDDGEDDNYGMENEGIIAIQKFEQMLKEQKQFKKKEDGQQNEPLLEEEDEDTQRIKNVQGAIQSIKQEQLALNQEILFSPGKPITFRCQLDTQSKKNQKESQLPQLQQENDQTEEANLPQNLDSKAIQQPINQIESCESLDQSEEQESNEENEQEQEQQQQQQTKEEEEEDKEENAEQQQQQQQQSQQQALEQSKDQTQSSNEKEENRENREEVGGEREQGEEQLEKGEIIKNSAGQ